MYLLYFWGSEFNWHSIHSLFLLYMKWICSYDPELFSFSLLHVEFIREYKQFDMRNGSQTGLVVSHRWSLQLVELVSVVSFFTSYFVLLIFILFSSMVRVCCGRRISDYSARFLHWFRTHFSSVEVYGCMIYPI